MNINWDRCYNQVHRLSITARFKTWSEIITEDFAPSYQVLVINLSRYFTIMPNHYVTLLPCKFLSYRDVPRNTLMKLPRSSAINGQANSAYK